MGAVPGHEIDDPTLSEDRERHLGSNYPTIETGEMPRDLFMKSSVAGVDQALEIRASPTRHEVNPDVQRGRELPDRADRVVVDMAPLDPRDHRSMDACRLGQVALAPAAAMSDRAKHRP